MHSVAILYEVFLNEVFQLNLYFVFKNYPRTGCRTVPSAHLTNLEQAFGHKGFV